jgi:hypothetical protein
MHFTQIGNFVKGTSHIVNATDKNLYGRVSPPYLSFIFLNLLSKMGLQVRFYFVVIRGLFGSFVYRGDNYQERWEHDVCYVTS